MPIVWGLASAASWGLGDFGGGLAAKRGHVYSVVIPSNAVGIAVLSGLALLRAEPVPLAADIRWAVAAGVCGGIGVVALYRGLANGRMGVVAPVSAIVTAILPILFGLFTQGLPAAQRVAGFGAALVAVWFVSRTGQATTLQLRDLGISSLAGLGFGGFLIFMAQVQSSSILWPLTFARSASLLLMLTAVALTRQKALPARSQLLLPALVGLLDTGGNAFYLLAAHAGRLDIAAVLSSLYPAETVLLAWFLLKEPISRIQSIGIAITLVAIGLIAA